MDLESNVPISTSPSMNTTLPLDLGSCQPGKCDTHTFTSLENQTTEVPLSRKRKLAIQSAQQHEHGEASSTLDAEQCAPKIPISDSYSTSTSDTCWLEHGSYRNVVDFNDEDGGGIDNGEESIMVDYKLEYVQQQQQSNILWSNEKAEWGSLKSDSQSHNRFYQPLRQYCSQEYYDNYPQHQQQQQYSFTSVIGHTDGSLLEHTSATATPAFLDWSPTLHTPSEYVTDQNQCFSHPTYSACTTDCNDDGCLDSASLEHKQQPSDHATPMHAIDERYPHLKMQQRQNNDIRQKYQQSSNLTLDLKNLSNVPIMAAPDEDSPMTPALFSPSFIDALDDIYMTTAPATMALGDQSYQEMGTANTAPNILATPNMDYANSSTTGSHHDWHVLNQQRLLLAQYHQNYNDLTPHVTHGSDVLSEQSASIIPGSALSAGNEPSIEQQYHANHLLSTRLTEFNGSLRRRSSNNTASTRSSISDVLVTPKSQAHIPSMQPFGQVTPMLQQYQQDHTKQKHQSSVVSPSLEMTQTTPESPPRTSQSPKLDYGNVTPTEPVHYSSYGNKYYHNNKPALEILDEEEENRVFNQQQQLENNSKLMTSYTTKMSLQQAIRTYLSRPNVTTTGELTVMISTSKVAQKSYGTEKRFLCPPPCITLVGANWWTRDMLFNRESDDQLDVLRPPMIQIQIANDLARAGAVSTISIPPGSIEWMTLSGLYWNEATTKMHTPPDTATDRNSYEDSGKISNFKDWQSSSTTAAAAAATSAATSASASAAAIAAMDTTGRSIRMNEPIVSGRCVSKNMYISDSDEKRKTVEMLVRLQLANGLNLGVFKSKEIKVISKPSKKRQSLKNMELCVHHGSTVALFNRIRSQTVSTRYLGISDMDGSPVCYDNQQQATWNFNNKHHKEIKNVCFSAKTDSWDSFLIWIIDGSRTTIGDQNIPEKKKHDGQPSWPPPPAMAMESHRSGTPIPVYYNQPVVLQCMNTGLVSPVMIIRKVDFGNFAIGGMRSTDGLEAQHPGSLGVGGEYHDEDLGDPVSQLHKVAFQVIDDAISLKGCPDGYQQQQQQQYHGNLFNQIPFSLPHSIHPAKYLSCMKDVVGIYRTSGQRSQILANNSSKTPSHSSSVKLSAVHTDGSGENVQQVSPLLRNWLQSYHLNSDCCNDYSQQPYQYQQGSSKLQQDESPISQKRRVSCDSIGNHSVGMDWRTERTYTTSTETKEMASTSSPKTTNRGNRRRYSSANEQTRRFTGGGGGGALPRRRNSILSSSNPSSSLPPDTIASVNWQEEISETCIWSIVSTDTAAYTFWPSSLGVEHNEKGILHGPVTPVPYVKQCKITKENQMVIHGYGFTNDMVVWFGSLASTMLRVTPMKLELLVPDILLEGGQSSRCKGQEKGNGKEQMTNCMVKEENEQDEKGSAMNKVPILLVREGDGVVYRTQSWF